MGVNSKYVNAPKCCYIFGVSQMATLSYRTTENCLKNKFPLKCLYFVYCVQFKNGIETFSWKVHVYTCIHQSVFLPVSLYNMRNAYENLSRPLNFDIHFFYIYHQGYWLKKTSQRFCMLYFTNILVIIL